MPNFYMADVTTDGVRNQSENEELIENEDNQLIGNNVFNILWFRNMIMSKQILGIVMVIIASIFFAQIQVNTNHSNFVYYFEIKKSFMMILRFIK